MVEQGLEVDRAEEHPDIARRNGEKILANPSIALDTITHNQATFTNRDLAMFVHRHSARTIQFDAVMGAVKASRSEEHTSELQSLMRISYAVFCLKTTKTLTPPIT